MLARLGHGRVERPERDIVRPRLARFHREVAAVVAGYPDLLFRAEQRPRLAHVAVTLAEMDPVGVEPLGHRRAVVDDERDLMVGADPLQRVGEPGQFVAVDALGTQLERRRPAPRHRRAQPVGKSPADLERTDQVKLARLTPLRRGEAGEVGFVGKVIHPPLISEAAASVQ